MKYLISLLFVLAFLASPLVAADENPAKIDILGTLRKEHPRVILTPQRLTELQAAVKTDPAYQKLLATLEARGKKLLKADPIHYELIGPRLLDQSHKCVDEVTTCALLFRLTGEKAYADRAILEMTTAAAFKDWNPPPFPRHRRDDLRHGSRLRLALRHPHPRATQNHPHGHRHPRPPLR